MVGRAGQAPVPRVRSSRGRHLLAAHRAVLRGPAGLRGGQEVRPLAAAHRHHHHPRPQARDRLPIRGRLPVRAAPVGAGRPQEGIEVLEKGVRSPARFLAPSPGPRLLPLSLSARRPDRVARSCSEAAEMPGAAYWLQTMAADLSPRAATGPDLAAHVAADVRAGGAGDHPRNARVRLQILDSRDAADRLSGLVVEFEKDRGASRPGSRSCGEGAAAAGGRGPLVDGGRDTVRATMRSRHAFSSPPGRRCGGRTDTPEERRMSRPPHSGRRRS